MKKPSKYRFVTRRDGFRIEAPDRPTVSVDLCDTGFRVHGHEQRQLALFDDIAEDGSPLHEQREPPDTNLIQYQRLVDVVAQKVMSRWKPPEGRTAYWGVQQWAIKKTRRALGGRIHEQWRRLLAKTDPVVLAVQKAVFAATFRESDLLHSPQLYEDRYLAQDIIRYRAAAALVPIAEDLYARQNRREARGHERTQRCDDERGDRDDENDDLDDDEPIYPIEDVIDRFSDWQGICSPTGTRYRSLSRTLMQLPGGVPSRLLYHLPMILLARPVTDRLELATLLLSKGEATNEIAYAAPPMHAFHHATQDQIRDGMQQLSTQLARPLSHRRTADIATFVRYLLDFPEHHRGGLPTLVRKSIRWHDAAGWHHRDEFFLETEFFLEAGLDESTPTKQPPIPLPAQPGVHFLANVGEVLSEGKRMKHCIGGYAGRAVQGHCFLFHIDHEGECASVEIDPAGRVRQSFGPQNQSNRATKYATGVLSTWAKDFPNAGPWYADSFI